MGAMHSRFKDDTVMGTARLKVAYKKIMSYVLSCPSPSSPMLLRICMYLVAKLEVLI